MPTTPPLKPIKPTVAHALGSGLAPLSSIHISDRMRRDDPTIRRWIEEHLAPCIAAVGLIQPVLLIPIIEEDPLYLEGFRYELVAGWCRLQAFLLLKHTEIPFTLFNALSSSQRLEIELNENLRRRGMRWQEECVGIYNVHQAKSSEKTRDFKTWGQRETGVLFGVAASQVNTALRLAQHILTEDKEIIAAPTPTAACQILLLRKQDEATRLLAKHSSQNLSPIPLSPKAKAPSTSGPLISDDLLFKPSVLKQNATTALPQQNAEIETSKFILNVDCRDYAANHEGEHFDMIFTDIPYGLNPEDLEHLKDFKVIEASHQQEENLTLMPQFLNLSFKLLRTNGWLVFYYDILHQEKLRGWAEAAGFVVQPFPLLWLKPTARNSAPNKQWPKTCEYLMVCRKGSPVMIKVQTSNFMTASNDAERKQQRNPFAKPFLVTKWVSDALLLPGSQVLDPFAGGGSIARGLINLGMKVTALEKDSEWYPDLLKNIQDVYRSMLAGKVTFS